MESKDKSVIRCPATGDVIESTRNATNVQVKMIGQGNALTSSIHYLKPEHIPPEVLNHTSANIGEPFDLKLVVNTYKNILYATNADDAYWSALSMEEDSLNYLTAIVNEVLE